jgi:hypothetical protein
MNIILKSTRLLRKAEEIILGIEDSLLDTSIAGLTTKKNYVEHSKKITAAVTFLHFEIVGSLSELKPRNGSIEQVIEELKNCAYALGGAGAQLNILNDGLQRKASGGVYAMKSYTDDLEQYKVMKHFYEDCKNIFLNIAEQYADELALFDNYPEQDALSIATISHNPIDQPAASQNLSPQKKLKTWYESDFGIGQKTSDLYLLQYEIRSQTSPERGIQILFTHPRKVGQQIPRFIPDDEIEKKQMSSQTQISSCPKCRTECAAKIEVSMFFGCEKCGFTWWQRK